MRTIDKWVIGGKTEGFNGCVIALPGRGLPATMMEKFMLHTDLWDSLQVILEPRQLEWYPQPNGPWDQKASVYGQNDSLELLDRCVKRLEKGWGVKRQQTVLVGFSAGAVMSIWLGAHSNKPFAGVISLAGAILEPTQLPKAKHKTPFLIQHNRDDDCFKWGERYLPMKRALLRQGYNVNFKEGHGGHTLTFDEVSMTRRFCRNIFQYPEEESTKEKSADDRIKIYHAIIKAQDSMSVSKARESVANQFGLSTSQVRDIELEGLREKWPLPEPTASASS